MLMLERIRREGAKRDHLDMHECNREEPAEDKDFLPRAGKRYTCRRGGKELEEGKGGR